MKAAASENKNVNIKWFRGTPNDLLDLYEKVLKDPLVQSQKSNLTFRVLLHLLVCFTKE